MTERSTSAVLSRKPRRAIRSTSLRALAVAAHLERARREQNSPRDTAT